MQTVNSVNCRSGTFVLLVGLLTKLTTSTGSRCVIGGPALVFHKALTQDGGACRLTLLLVL